MYINATDIFREKFHIVPIIKCKKKIIISEFCIILCFYMMVFKTSLNVWYLSFMYVCLPVFFFCIHKLLKFNYDLLPHPKYNYF